MATKKAVKERKFRRKEQERKHFDAPMRSFIQHKYPLIFDEYKAFYQSLCKDHPEARDITKTCTYKAWVSSLNRQEPSTIVAVALRQALNQEENPASDGQNDSTGQQNSDESDQSTDHISDDESANQENYDDQNRMPKSPGQNITFTITDNERESETGEVVNVVVDINELAGMMETVHAQVDGIMKELGRDEALANILNRPVDDVDEGIQLEPLDDIDIDLEVQPFDFDLEVDRYEW